MITLTLKPAPGVKVEPSLSYTVALSVRAARSIVSFIPAKVCAYANGHQYEFVLHRRRLHHCVAFPAMGQQLLDGIRVETSRSIRSIELTDLHINEALGRILVISPHPDDAELVAGGLYMAHSEQVFIATMSAGERIDRLSAQYVKGLEMDLDGARQNKARIRTWNSVHTPSLSGIPVSRCVNLGLPDAGLSDIANDHCDGSATCHEKGQRRSYNAFAMPGDKNGRHDRTATLTDLTFLIDAWRPDTLVVMDPEIDVHRDHRASSLLVADALAQAQHEAKRILLCSVHHRNRLLSHPGPAFSAAYSVSDVDRTVRIFSEVDRYVHVLSAHDIRRKAMLFETMCELSNRRMFAVNLFLAFIRFDFRLRSIRVAGGRHVYYNRFLRNTEFFRQVSAAHFVSSVQAARASFK